MKRKPPLGEPLIATPTSKEKREYKGRKKDKNLQSQNLHSLLASNKPYQNQPPALLKNKSVHKSIKRFFLPILQWMTKMKIPINPPTSPTHNLRHWRVLCPTKTVKFWKSLFESTIPTPHYFQNFTLLPSPTSYCRSLEKFNQPLLINLQRLTPYLLVTFFVH